MIRFSIREVAKRLVRTVIVWVRAGQSGNEALNRRKKVKVNGCSIWARRWLVDVNDVDNQGGVRAPVLAISNLLYVNVSIDQAGMISGEMTTGK